MVEQCDHHFEVRVLASETDQTSDFLPKCRDDKDFSIVIVRCESEHNMRAKERVDQRSVNASLPVADDSLCNNLLNLSHKKEKRSNLLSSQLPKVMKSTNAKSNMKFFIFDLFY